MNLTFSAEFYPNGKPAVETIGAPVTRKQLLELESTMTKELDTIDPESVVTHHFAPGLYAREMALRAGDAIVGKIHKHDHLAMLVSGEMRIADELGRRIVRGPYLWRSAAGIKRAGYALTDIIFITFHPTDETDLAKIESDVIAPSFEALENFQRNTICHGEQ